MIRKKNRFLTFIFSLIPGAGEMYMGFMKQGVTLMGACFLLIFLAAWLNIGPLLFILPLLWCYSFFHVHNVKSLPDEEFYALEDDYMFHLGRVLPDNLNLDKKAKNVLAILLIGIGVVLLWDNLMDIMGWIVPSYLEELYWGIRHMAPQLVIALLLIVGGIWLIRGKKKELDKEEAEEK